LQATAECGSFRLTKNLAHVLLIELHAAHASRLAIWHARNRAVNRRGDATRAAMVSTFHGEL